MALLYILLFLYGFLLFGLAIAALIEPKKEAAAPADLPAVSVLICMRNEEDHIAACLNSIFEQVYPKERVQLILVDDQSTDQSATIAEDLLKTAPFDSLLMRNHSRQGKKASIQQAMGQAKHPLILLRDADTLSAGKHWLNSMLGFQRQGNYDMVIGPIGLVKPLGRLAELQAIENNILQLLAAGSAALGKPFLCSAANLLFKRSAFEAVNGFTSHLHIASGDDVLFMEELKRRRSFRIAYGSLAQALVLTYPKMEWKSLVRQRTRWASKFRHNPNPLNRLLAGLVFLLNVLWVLVCISLPVYSFHFSLLLFLLLKSGADIFLLFLSRESMPLHLSTASILYNTLVYPFYAVLIGLRALFLKPSWN